MRTRVIVEIADNGPGIPAAIADQLFTPFVTGKPDGLGLGLGIARDIAREFGGDLDLAPSALGGAAFRIVAEARMSFFVDSQIVCFVDDDAKLREANVQSLELAGIRGRGLWRCRKRARRDRRRTSAASSSPTSACRAWTGSSSSPAFARSIPRFR